MEIRIDKDHIEQGVCGSAYDCAAALALKAAGYEGVEVAGWVKFETPGIDGGLRQYHSYKVTASLRDFLAAFDEGNVVQPGRLMLSEWPAFNGQECLAGFVAAAGEGFSGRRKETLLSDMVAAAADCQG